MKPKTKIDFTKDYGTICGGNSRAVYSQDGIEFDSRGDRLTPFTPEEHAAIDAELGLMKAKKDLDEAKAASFQAASEANRILNAVHDVIPQRKPGVPKDIDSMQKDIMINIALNRFGKKIPKSYSRTKVQEMLEALY
jgi:hypothetical protein